MMRTALRTFPAPHSETCDTFRAAEASALRTGSGSVSLVNLDIHGLPSGKFIPQHMPEHRPAGVGNGFCHPCLFELGGVHIADSDQTVFSRQFGTGDVKMMTASIGDLGMDSLGAPTVAGPLSDSELLFVLPVVAKSGDFLPVAACGERLEAEVDTNLAIACDEVIFDLALEGDIPPPASVLDEGAGLERPIDLARLPETEPALEINDGITINLECARDERNPAKRTFGAKAGSKTWAAAVDIARSNELTANRLRRVGVQSEFGSASRCQLDQIKCSRPASSHSSFTAPLSLSLGSDAKIPNLIAGDREFFELPARRSVFDAEFSREDHVENIPPRDFAHKSHNHTSEDEQMPMVTRFHVEMHTRSGSARYLTQFGSGMEWTSNGEDSFEYDDVEEADADAQRYGGEVFEFQRHARPGEIVLHRFERNPIVHGAVIGRLEAAE